jgi:hypothetical protein
VPIGNEKYVFERDAEGRALCDVWIEDHIEAFLSVDYLYRKFDGKMEPLAVMAEPKDTTESRWQAEDMADLRTEYTKTVGKKPFNGWNAATLREKIEQHKVAA